MPSIQSLKFFYQSLLKDISNIPENELRQIKTSPRNTRDKYTKIKGPYKYRKDVKELSERRDIAISKTDKGRGVVIMNRDNTRKNVYKYLIQTSLLNLIQIQRKQQKENYRMFYGKLNQSFHQMNTNSCTQLDHPLTNFMGQQKYINCLKVIN